MTSNTSGFTPSRRTLVKGAAWSVPVVAVAGAAPAIAASPFEVIDWENSSACKIPGNSMGYCYNKGYVLWAAFENPTNRDLTICITGMTVGGVTQCIVGLADTQVSCDTPIGNCFELPANGTRYIAIYSNAATDSGSNTVVVNFTYEQPGDQPAPAYTSGNVTGGSWSGDTGQGSCRHGCATGAPISACGANCADGAAVAHSQVEEDTLKSDTEDLTVEQPAVETESAPADQAPAAPVETTDNASTTSAP